jgi:hypothetical protein
MQHIKFLHTVLFWLKDPKSDSTKFETCLTTFMNNSKYVDISFYGTAPLAERGIIDDSFTYKLSVGFTSKERHDAYQVEEAHVIFIKEASQLWEKVIVYDSSKENDSK